MIAIEERPELKLGPGFEARLTLERTDIEFHELPGDRIRIQVAIRNAGGQCSLPTSMRIETAPLGAFVPWRPLARMLVPALEPGEGRVLTTEAVRPRPVPLGDFNRLPPERLLAAVSSPELPSESRGGVAGLRNLFRRSETTRSVRPDPAEPGKALLAPDLWDLAGRSQPYWAGNLNVFVGNHAVERHLAKSLRIFPGRTNLAMFMVGGPEPDAYAFKLVGLPADWRAGFCDATNRRTLRLDTGERGIEQGRWVESIGGLLLMLVIGPPADCQAGKLEVHVTKRSRQKTAVVEFDLDPKAQGAGCYTL